MQEAIILTKNQFKEIYRSIEHVYSSTAMAKLEWTPEYLTI